MPDTPNQKEEIFTPWVSMERVRAEWVPIQHGEYVKHQNLQKSNNSLTDDQVLQKRAEPLGTSFAPPLGPNMRSGGPSDEPSGRERTT